MQQSLLKLAVKMEWRPYVASAFLGVGFALGFAPFSLWGLALLSLCAFFALQMRMPSLRVGLKSSFVFAFVLYAFSLYWLYHSFYVTLGSLPLAVLSGGVAVVGIACAFSLPFLLLAYVFWVLRQRQWPSFVVPFVITFVWFLGEWVRTSAVPTFSWHLAGYIWADSAPMLQVVSFLGVYGLSALLVFVCALFAAGCEKAKLLGSLLLLVQLAYGVWVLNENPKEDVSVYVDGKLTVDLMRGGASQFDKWTIEGSRRYLHAYLNASNGASVPDLTIWPETSVTTFLDGSDALRRYVQDRHGGGAWFVGAPRKEVDAFYNSAFYVNGGSDVVAYYDKRYLVPFGEYFPLRNVFPKLFELFLQGQGDYTAGADSQELFRVGDLKFAPLICGEIVLPNLPQLLNGDADYIVNITNDAWFEGTIAPAQLLAMTKVQAVVLKKPVLRVSNTGTTAVIDAFGRVIARVEEGVSSRQFLRLRVYL